MLPFVFLEYLIDEHHIALWLVSDRSKVLFAHFVHLTDLGRTFESSAILSTYFIEHVLFAHH